MRHPELFARYESVWGELGEILHYQHETLRRREFWTLTFRPPGQVARIATYGLGSVVTDESMLLACELMLAVAEQDLDEIGHRRVADFLADIAVTCINRPFRPTEGSTMLTSIAPWAPQCVLFDTPLGEPEHLEAFHADGLDLELFVVVPIHEEEMSLIRANGLEAFDALRQQSEFSLADVRRPSFV